MADMAPWRRFVYGRIPLLSAGALATKLATWLQITCRKTDTGIIRSDIVFYLASFYFAASSDDLIKIAASSFFQSSLFNRMAA